MDALITNGKLIQQDFESDRLEPSPCEVLCEAQQNSIKNCMSSLQEMTEKDQPKSPKANLCLGPTIAAWTKCCQDANKVSRILVCHY